MIRSVLSDYCNRTTQVAYFWAFQKGSDRN